MANQFETVTTEVFIKRAKDRHGDRYDYSKSKYTNKSEKIIIICKIHGEFLQLPSNHYKCGCLKCSILEKAANKSNRLSTEKFINRAKEIHGDKYDYSLIVYETPKKKFDVICSEHGKFQSNYGLLVGIGCPKCGVIKASSTKVKNGNAISADNRTAYELYESRVNRITEYNYRNYKEKINPNNYKRARTNGYHLDHKFSKQEGFLQGIAPEIIGHWSNLQMLPAKENRLKYSACSINKEELIENYKYIISSEFS